MVYILKMVMLFLFVVIIPNNNIKDQLFYTPVVYKATYYASFFEGRTTSLGHKFTNNGLTMATTNKRFYGKHIVVRNPETGKTLRLYCNDLMNPRMKKHKVVFDLTQRAMKVLSGKNKHYPGNINLSVVSIKD